jgi:hypothetical protein
MSPADVVRTVVLALQHNDTPSPDAGIATAFRFASPGNRQSTGPLEHFIKMVKNPAYAALLNFESAEFADPQIRDDQARVAVKLTMPDGTTIIYIWGLSRQGEGDFKGCWMTDSVVPLVPRPYAPVPRDQKHEQV